MFDAEQLLRKVLENQPNHVAALNLLTVVLMSMERFLGAEEFIAKAVRLNQSSDVSYYKAKIGPPAYGKKSRFRSLQTAQR